MKQLNLIMLLFVSTIFFSCKSQKYTNLGDGLFADIQTNKGNIVVKLHYGETPVTVANFVTLAEGTNPFVKDEFKKKPFYEGVIFHRVIKDFMIQGGDPTGTGMGEPGYRFEDEIVDNLKHDKKGILSMANSGPASNGCQFFITHVPTPHLDGGHTVFGETMQGLDVIDAIATTPTAAGNRPIEDVKIQKVIIVRNGNEAKKFDAKKVLENYFEQVSKKEKEKEEKKKAAIQNFLSEIKEQEAMAKKLPSGVKIVMLNDAKGQKPTNTQQVLVNYAGYLTDGTLFDSNVKSVEEAYGKFNPNRERGGEYQPFQVPYNTGARLIPGFKEAILTLKVGDKARVFIPSVLAYGEQGAGDLIPPNSDLIFDIEIVGIAK